MFFFTYSLHSDTFQVDCAIEKKTIFYNPKLFTIHLGRRRLLSTPKLEFLRQLPNIFLFLLYIFITYLLQNQNSKIINQTQNTENQITPKKKA